MDIFAKQCEKAVEIQKLCPYNRHDYFAVRNTDHTFRWSARNRPREEYIWLPTQVQFQGMLNDNINQVVKQGGIVGCLHFNSLPEMLAMSWEQLWLALVMRGLYSKRWNGEDWVRYTV